MAGFTRRDKPLKARSNLADLLGLSITSPANGDLLIYDSADAEWENGKTLTGNYVVVGTLSATNLVATTGVTTAALTVTANATVGGNLTVTGTLTSGNLAIVNLTVSGNATFAGTVAISGLLTGAGFSFSGAGVVSGALTLGSTLSVTGAATFSSTLSAGATTVASLVDTGNALVGGNLVVVGNISGATIAGGTVSSAGTIYGGTTLNLNGAVYTNNDITFIDDATAWQIYNGTLLSLSLDSASIIEGTGNPTNALAYTAGSLYLRTDGDRDQTLWVRGPGAWFPVRDSRDDLDFLLVDWDERQEFILTGSLEAGDITAGSMQSGRYGFPQSGLTFDAATGDTILSTTSRASYLTSVTATPGLNPFIRFTDDGKLIISHNQPVYIEPQLFGGSTPTQFAIQSNFSAFTVDTYNATSTAFNSHFGMRRSRSNTVGAFEAVQTGDRIGSMSFQGVPDTLVWAYAAQMNVYVEGTPASGIVPAYMNFVTAHATNGLVERLRLTGDGYVSVRSANKLQVIDSFGTGGQTATFVAANKPGVGTTAPTQWLTVNLNGTDYYIPCFL